MKKSENMRIIWASIFAQFAEVGIRHAKPLNWLTRQTLNSINKLNVTPSLMHVLHND
jgi:hypothetical protein